MIVSAAMVAVFALSPPIADAAATIKRAVRKNRPLIGTDPPTE
jgi:RecJ-like exonuclease